MNSKVISLNTGFPPRFVAFNTEEWTNELMQFVTGKVIRKIIKRRCAAEISEFVWSESKK